MLVALSLAAALMLLLKPYWFLAAIDVLAVIHTGAALILIIYFTRTRKPYGEEDEVDNRRFEFVKKKTDASPSSWRAQFAGSFEVVQRPKFKEYLIGCGVNSFAASLASTRGRTMIFERDPADENRMNIRSEGVPPFCGVWLVATEREEDAVAGEVFDNGKRLLMKVWWNEAEQALMLYFDQFNPDGTMWISRQTRKMLDENTLSYRITMTLPGNKEVGYEEILRKKTD